MSFQIRDVEYFATIAELGQLQRAADVLQLSQAALSKSLRRLEIAMNSRLLTRTPKGVELTVTGAALLAQAARLRLSAEDVTREITDLAEGHAGYLRIAASAGAGMDIAPRTCAALLEEAPKVTVKLSVMENKSMLPNLRNGSLDLAITMLDKIQPVDLEQDHIYDESWVIYASASHRLAKRRKVGLADLVDERWAMASPHSPTHLLLAQAFRDRGLPTPRLVVETTYLPARHHLIAESDLLGLGVRSIVRQGAMRYPLVELNVMDFNYVRRGGVVYRKGSYLSPAARRFIELFKRIAKEFADKQPGTKVSR